MKILSSRNDSSAFFSNRNLTTRKWLFFVAFEFQKFYLQNYFTKIRGVNFFFTVCSLMFSSKIVNLLTMSKLPSEAAFHKAE